MSIKSITLENFKSFDKPEKMDFEDITILTGPNSSGKSSFMKGFMLLADNFNKKTSSFFLNNIPRKLDLNQSKLKLGEFETLLYYNRNKEEVSFTIEISDTEFNHLQIPIFKGHNFTCTVVYRLCRGKNPLGHNTLAKLNLKLNSELLYEVCLEGIDDNIIHKVRPLVLLKSMRLGPYVLENSELDKDTLKIYLRLNNLFDAYIKMAKKSDLKNEFIFCEAMYRKSDNQRGKTFHGGIWREDKLESIADSYLFTTHRYGMIDLLFKAIIPGNENKTMSLNRVWIREFLNFKDSLKSNVSFNKLIMDKYFNKIWDRESQKPIGLSKDLIDLLCQYDLSFELMRQMMEFKDSNRGDDSSESIYGAIISDLKSLDKETFDRQLVKINNQISKINLTLNKLEEQNAREASKYKDSVNKDIRVNEKKYNELSQRMAEIKEMLKIEIIPIKISLLENELNEIMSNLKLLSVAREELMLSIHEREQSTLVESLKLRSQNEELKNNRFNMQLQYEQYPPLQKSYHKLVQTLKRMRNTPIGVEHFLYKVLKPVFEGLKGVEYIGVAERSYQERVFHNQNSSILNKLLKSGLIQDLNSNRKIKKFVNKWLREFEIGMDFRVSSHENEVYSIEIEKTSKKWLNSADLGVGSIQLLTMVFAVVCSECSKSKRNDILTFLIEEPEASLHPSYQSKFIDFINACRAEFGSRFVIETHSIYLVRKLQNLVAAQGAGLSSDKVLIYYFDGDKKKKERKYPIKIEPNGSLSRSFGRGFLDMESELTFQRLTIKNASTK